MVATVLRSRTVYAAVLAAFLHAAAAIRLTDEGVHKAIMGLEADADVQQGEGDDSYYRPSQTLVDTTLGVVKQYLKFVTGEQSKVRNQVEGMERAFQSRLDKLNAQLAKEIQAGVFTPDQRLDEAKAKMDSDNKVAKDVFLKCREKSRQDENKASQLMADIKKCKKFAEERDDKEKLAQETVAKNRPKAEQEKALQQQVYAKLEQLERDRDDWSDKFQDAELKMKTAFNFAAQANSSLEILIESRDKIEREKAERLNELKRRVDAAENTSVSTGVVHAGTVGIARELYKASDDVLKDAQSTEKAATDLLDLLGDLRGAIDKLFFTGTDNLGMTTEEFFDFEEEVYKAFSTRPIDVAGVNVDDWKNTFESMRAAKEGLLIDVAKQVKDLMDNSEGSLFANMRGLTSNTLLAGPVLPLLTEIQREVSQAAALNTAAACTWYNDATYGPTAKNAAVVDSCASLTAPGAGGDSLLQAKALVMSKMKFGSSSTVKSRITTSPSLAKDLGDLESILTANKLEMQSRRMGLALSNDAKDAIVSGVKAGEVDKQAKAEEQARRQEILDEEKRKYLEWLAQQDEEIAKIDKQLSERNAVAEEARVEFEQVKAKLQEVQGMLDWENEPAQVRARENEIAKHQDNLRQLEEEDARVTAEYIAAAESVKQCADRVLEINVRNAQMLEQGNLKTTADAKAAEARKLMDAAAQADKKCKNDFRDTKKQIEADYAAKQDELEVARSINDVQRVKLMEYKTALAKCNEDYDNVLALSVEVESYHVKVLDPYFAALTSLQTGLGVLLFDALEKETFESRTAETDRLAKKTPMNESAMVTLANQISSSTPAVLSKGEAIKQKLQTWVPLFNFDSRSQMQGQMDVLLEEVKKTRPMALIPWCKWYALYYLKQDSLLDFDECLQQIGKIQLDDDLDDVDDDDDEDPLTKLEEVIAQKVPSGDKVEAQVQAQPKYAEQDCTHLDDEDDCIESNIKYQPGTKVEVKCSRSRPDIVGQRAITGKSWCEKSISRRVYEISFLNGTKVNVWQSRLRLHRQRPKAASAPARLNVPL